MRNVTSLRTHNVASPAFGDTAIEQEIQAKPDTETTAEPDFLAGKAACNLSGETGCEACQ